MNRQYYGIEAIDMTPTQRQLLVSILWDLGHNTHANPSHRNHWRVRLDNQAVIFEGLFDDGDWTVNAVRQRLATVFGVALNLVTASTANTAYGPVVTISYGGQQRLRMIAFGGLLATWDQSHDQVLAYLAANSAAWEEQT